MKHIFALLACGICLCGCSKNEPGTMGGGNEPKTVSTGAPADAARGSGASDPNQSAIASEHAMSSFDRNGTNNLGAPDASTRSNSAATR